MFELVKNDKDNCFNICVNGKVYLGSFVDGNPLREPKEFTTFFSKEREIIEVFLSCKLADFSRHFPNFERIILSNVFDWVDFNHSLVIGVNYKLRIISRKFSILDGVVVTFVFEPDLGVWKKNFSFSDYNRKIEEAMEKSQILKGQFDFGLPQETNSFYSFKIPYFLPSIKDFLADYFMELNRIHELTILQLQLKENHNTLDTIFNFPEGLKVPCEQYLQYFAQFLQDLGINTTSNIEEEAGKVLFSVTPTDDVEALDKIREALAVYLKLPSSPIVYDDSFKAMRLQAEIERLQSSQRIAEMEFRVAHKALESQDKIILQQSVLLEQQGRIIEKISSKSVMIDSAENKEELEKIYEGIEVGESKFLKEKLGIKLNPAKVIKTAVRNTFGKGDEIIELGLNKDE